MKTRIKHILKIITSKTFLGALAFSIALWLYITLNTEFVSFVKVPLKIKLPKDKSIEKPIPDHISVEVRATGWQIFSLKYFNTASNCFIDLSSNKIIDTLYAINRTDIIKNLSDMGNVQAIDIVPQSLNLTLGQIGEYAVIVEPDVEILPHEDYLLVGEIKTKPDLIIIRGNDKKIRGITRWKTVHRVFKDVTESIKMKIPLSDTLTNIIDLSHRAVLLNADIQKIAEITIQDIRLQYNGADLSSHHKILPEYFDVTIRGGIKDIENLNVDDIMVTVNTTDVINDTTGLLEPIVVVPRNLKKIKINPPYVVHTIERKSSFLARMK